MFIDRKKMPSLFAKLISALFSMLMISSCSYFDTQDEIPKANFVGWGYYNVKTKIWYEADSIRILTLDSSSLNLETTLSSTANYWVKVDFLGWNAAPSKLCATFSVRDDNGKSISSTVPITLFQYPNDSGKQTFYSIKYADDGTYIDGKSLLLLSDRTYDGIVYPKVRLLYLPSISNTKYSASVTIPYNQSGCR